MSERRGRVWEAPGDREVFSLPLEVRPEDIDANGHVNNVVYVRWLQEAGTAHWLARFGPEVTGRWSWIALRHEIDYLRPLRPGDAARARTWVGTPQGARFERVVVINGPEGPAAQGRSDWVLVDAASLKPARIPGWMAEPFRR